MDKRQQERRDQLEAEWASFLRARQELAGTRQARMLPGGVEKDPRGAPLANVVLSSRYLRVPGVVPTVYSLGGVEAPWA